MDIRVSEFAPIVIYVCILYSIFYTEKRSVKILVSEFAPTVIYVCILYFVFYTEKRSVKISQNIIIITMTSNFIYNRVSPIDHVKRNALILA